MISCPEAEFCWRVAHFRPYIEPFLDSAISFHDIFLEILSVSLPSSILSSARFFGAYGDGVT